MEYRHTQMGKLALLVLAWGAAITALTAAGGGPGQAVRIGSISVALSAVAAVFSRLTVAVTAGTVRATFGWGWPRRTIAVDDIAGFRKVRNKWYYGWGVRRLPKGWMFNVWGLDAVEIDLRSGKTVRIGSDEPDDLVAALAAQTMLRPGG